MVDLFRHEILHALGFGLMIPSQALSSNANKRRLWWIDESGSQWITTYYMDFQNKAVDAARNHFGCQDLDGIEADNVDKIHLKRTDDSNIIKWTKLFYNNICLDSGSNETW